MNGRLMSQAARGDSNPYRFDGNTFTDIAQPKDSPVPWGPLEMLIGVATGIADLPISTLNLLTGNLYGFESYNVSDLQRAVYGETFGKYYRNSYSYYAGQIGFDLGLGVASVGANSTIAAAKGATLAARVGNIVRAGTAAQRLSLGVAAYDTLSAAGAFAQSTNSLYNGTFTPLDTIGFIPAAGFAAGRMGRSRGIFSRVDDVAPNSTSGKFRGEPFAFGTSSRSQRALAMAEEAARASNVNLFDVVDEVRYVRGSSYFDVDLSGKRVLHIGENAFGRNRTGQILEATHELIHAQRYNNVLRRTGGNIVQAYNDYFLAKPFGSDLYALEEVTTEMLALRRVQNYFGEISSQQIAASTRYINHWMSRFLGNN